MSSTSYIYTGPWVNRSQSTLLGATITLATRDGAFLLALLAVVVTSAGQSFWNIVSYILHQARSKDGGTHDALHYQQQAILRNSGSSLNAAWKFAGASFSWRKHERSKWWQFWRSRTLFLILTALIIFAAFAVASLFSSRVSNSVSTEVLIHSPDCGFWEFNTSTSLYSLSGFQFKSANDSAAAASYARTCYGTNNTNPLQCNTYAVPEITWTLNRNASCPFAASTCMWSPKAAYQMDTGPLDSHSILGLNAHPSERIQLRKVATCAPIIAYPYAATINQSVDGGLEVDQFIQLAMGPVPGTNFTYEYNKHAVFVLIGYGLETESTYAGWAPIADFDRTDADVTMFFLTSNSITSPYANSDPLFSATTEIDIPDGTYYEADAFITVMGCTDQYQICNPARTGLDGCTPLGTWGSLNNAASNIGLNDYQLSTQDTINIAMRESNMFNSVFGRGASALKAQSTVFERFQEAQLPNNQWQIEASNWFAVSLASLQQALVEIATGPVDIVSSGGYVVPFSNLYAQAICKRQMIRNVNGYMNFSTLGVGIVLIVGTIVIILGWVIDTVGEFVQKLLRKKDHKYARLAWISDGYLQLQRLAYEGAGYTNWKGCADNVPVSSLLDSKSQQLGGLVIDDVNHPEFVKATPCPDSSLDDGPPQEGRSGGQIADHLDARPAQDD